MRALAISLREMRAMLLEKSFLLMLLLQLLLVSSSSLLGVGYAIMTSPESSTTLTQLSNLIYVGVVSNTRGPFSEALSAQKVHHTFYDNFALAHKDFREGLIDAVLVGDLSEDYKPSVVTVYIPSNSPKTPLTKLALKKTLLAMEGDVRDDKVRAYAPRLDIATYRIMGYKPQARHVEIYYVFTLPLLLFLPCVVSGSLVIDSITQDLESRRILNLTAAPLKPSEIVFGKAAASFTLSLLQSAAWLIILSLTFVNPQNHEALIVLCGLYTVIFMNAGSVLALHLRKMQSSQILYTFISMGAISLFSPFANIHPLLLEFSPSSMIASIAFGASPWDYVWQYAALTLLAASSTASVAKYAYKINVK